MRENDEALVSSPGNPAPHSPGWASGASTEAAETPGPQHGGRPMTLRECTDAEDSTAFQEAVNAPYQPSARPIPMDRTASAISSENLPNRFTYHPPSESQQRRYDTLRTMGLQLAETILRLSPNSREQSLALTKVEEAIFWVNAAIARNE